MWCDVYVGCVFVSIYLARVSSYVCRLRTMGGACEREFGLLAIEG
jgi:hypothetical protein